MTYVANYNTTDLSSIVVDFIGEYAVQFVAFAGLIALAIVIGFLLKKSKHLAPR